MNKNGIALPNGSYVREYQIEKELGTGSFGVTYLAIDTHLNRYVAIKEFLPNDIAIRQQDHTVSPKSNSDYEDFEYGLDRFIHEAKTLARFKHPNIVSIRSFFEANNTAYIVMGYEEGEDLEKYIHRKGKIEEDEILSIILPVLDGLREVHSQSYLHRDIKPANIYMRSNEIPMLIDFGATRYSIGLKSKSLSVILTVGYAPKEQYNSRAKQEPYTDLYAVGAVMYKMVTGKVPIEASARSDAITDDQPDPHVKLQDISGLDSYGESLKKTIDWALEFKPKHRPQNARVLQDALLMTQENSIDDISTEEEHHSHFYIGNGLYDGVEECNNIIENDTINNTTTIGTLMWQDEPYSIEEINAKANDSLNKWFRKKEYGKAVKWDNAVKYARNLNLGGYNNWRVPKLEELTQLLINRKHLIHEIESEVWSSTDDIEDLSKRGVNFDSDVDFEDAIDEDLVMLFNDSTNFIRCVRNI